MSKLHVVAHLHELHVTSFIPKAGSPITQTLQHPGSQQSSQDFSNSP